MLSHSEMTPIPAWPSSFVVLFHSFLVISSSSPFISSPPFHFIRHSLFILHSSIFRVLLPFISLRLCRSLTLLPFHYYFLGGGRLFVILRYDISVLDGFHFYHFHFAKYSAIQWLFYSKYLSIHSADSFISVGSFIHSFGGLNLFIEIIRHSSIFYSQSSVISNVSASQSVTHFNHYCVSMCIVNQWQYYQCQCVSIINIVSANKYSVVGLFSICRYQYSVLYSMSMVSLIRLFIHSTVFISVMRGHSAIVDIRPYSHSAIQYSSAIHCNVRINGLIPIQCIIRRSPSNRPARPFDWPLTIGPIGNPIQYCWLNTMSIWLTIEKHCRHPARIVSLLLSMSE